MEHFQTTMEQFNTRSSLPFRHLAKIALIWLLLPLVGCEERVQPWDKFADNPNVKLSRDRLGRVNSAITYNEKGEMHGITERYTALGTLSSRKNYVNGLEQGIARYFYINGSLQIEIDFVDGLPHGKYISYYPGGAVHRTKDFANGLAVGTSYNYYPNQSLQAMEKFKDGKLHGKIDYFNSDGRLIRRTTYIVGRIVRNEYPSSGHDLKTITARSLSK